MPSTRLLPSIDLTDDQAVADVDLFLDRRMVAIVVVDIASSTFRLVQMTDRAWCSVLERLLNCDTATVSLFIEVG